MLWLPFFVWYFLEYGFRLLQYRNRRQAYLAISFEREAYDNESRAEYLNSRKPFAWLQYYSHAPQD